MREPAEQRVCLADSGEALDREPHAAPFSYDDISIWLCRDFGCGVCGCG
jgi:hypothetical protein